jgi:hypothetical protein
MPKTRDELCRLAMDKFMTMTYTLTSKIVNLTRNKSEAVHCYEIQIPKMIKLYDVDTNHIIDGTAYGPGPVYSEQDLPETDYFIREFNNYFEDYAIYQDVQGTTGNASRRVAFVEITQVSADGENMIAFVIVKYTKSCKPYPVETNNNIELRFYDLQLQYNDLQLHARKLNSDNKFFRRRLSSTSRDLYRVTNEHNNKMTIYSSKISSLHTIIKTLYAKNTIAEDCPVCYESMPIDKLVVPECGHFICSSCSPQCTRCPICRDIGSTD